MSGTCDYCGREFDDHEWVICNIAAALERIAASMEADAAADAAEDALDREFNELMRQIVSNQQILLARVSTLEGSA